MRAANHSVAALAVFPLQDLLSLASENRMNLPGSLGGDNWRWRCLDDELSPQLAQWLAHLTAGARCCHFIHFDR